MEIKDLIPRRGVDALRIDDSDELVVMENHGALPNGKLRLNNHGLIVICTDGMAQFDYDGQQIRLRKDDLFLYMAHSVVSNFMSSSNFNCRQIWFSRSELWNINMYGEVSLADLFQGAYWHDTAGISEKISRWEVKRRHEFLIIYYK